MSLNFITVPTKRLSQSISSGSTSFKLGDILGWDGVALTAADFGTQAFAVFRNDANTLIEIVEFDPATIASASIAMTRRGLKFNSDTIATEVTANKLDWVKNETLVEIGTNSPQVYQWLKNYIDGVAIAGSPDASTIAKGLVEEATDAEVTAGTATGGTGAKLIITPQKLATFNTSREVTTSAGAGDVDKVPVLNASGKLDVSFMPQNPIVRTYLNAVSPATWTKPAGLKYIIVEVQATGGDGGSATGTDLKSGGGGAGGYGKKLIPASSLGVTETITIGALNTVSSFGSHITATNGESVLVNVTAGGVGGGCTGGDINITGQDGGTGGTLGGFGGSSVLGIGAGITNGATNGSNGVGYGGGGGGGNAVGSTDRSGGSASPAFVTIIEFYN